MCENVSETPHSGAKGAINSSPIIHIIAPYRFLEIRTTVNNNERIDKSHWICEYADDIFQTLRETETKRKWVEFKSHQVCYRPILLQLLKTATEYHKLARTTLHLAMYILDNFMDNHIIRATNLSLTAITCLAVAAKIEESDMNMPKFADLNKLVGNAYTLSEFKTKERKVLTEFEFELMRPTTATFVEHFANSIVTLDDFHVYLRNWYSGMLITDEQHMFLEPVGLLPLYNNYEDMVRSLSELLFELADVSLNYMKFDNARPSLIASACIAAVRRLKGITPMWSLYLIRLTEWTEDAISPFAEAIIALFERQANRQCAQTLSPQMVVGATPTILCDSPDSGIVSSADTKSDTSDDDDDDEDVEDDETEDDAYHCLEYPLPTKRRRIF